MDPENIPPQSASPPPVAGGSIGGPPMPPPQIPIEQPPQPKGFLKRNYKWLSVLIFVLIAGLVSYLIFAQKPTKCLSVTYSKAYGPICTAYSHKAR